MSWHPINGAPVCEATFGGKQVRALVDTGTEHSMIDSGSVAGDWVPVTQAIIHTTGGSRVLAVYSLGVNVRTWNCPSLLVVGADLSHLGVEAVIGRDILEHCTFTYDPRAGTFSLTF